MKFMLSNDTAQIPPLAEQVEAFLAQLGAGDIAMQVNLCLDELLTNIIQYGYADTASHSIEVELTVQDAVLKIEIIDDALPFDPTRDAQAPDLDAPLQSRRIGGLASIWPETSPIRWSIPLMDSSAIAWS